MQPIDVEIHFDTEPEARSAYGAGLRHGLVTTPVIPPPADGTPCRVALRFGWTDRPFALTGAVVHASPIATVIKLDAVPAELHRLAGGENAAPPAERPSIDSTPERPSTDSTPQRPSTDSTPPRPKKAAGAQPTPWAKRLAAASRPRPAAGAAPRTSTPSSDRLGEADPSTGIPVPFQPGRFLPGVARYEGTLPQHSLYQGFLQVHVAGLTGVCVIDGDRARYWAFFLRGRPAHFLRDPPLQNATTEALLIRRKLLNEGVLGRARWLAEITARPLISVVMRLGLIRPDQIQALRQEQTELVMTRVLGIRRGRYRFYDMPELAEVFSDSPQDAVPLLWRRAEASVAAMKPELLDRKLGVGRGQVFQRTELGRSVLDELPLQDEQRAVVDRAVRSGWPVADVLDRSSLSAVDARRLVLSLALLGLVEFVEPAREEREQAGAERALLHRHGRLRRNHFEFLELHWSALPAELEAACRRVEAQLAEVEGAEDPPAGADEMIGEIRLRLETIRGLAADRKARRAYRAEIAGRDKRDMAAELYQKQGEMAMFKRDLVTARECFERLLELDPGGAGSAERRERARTALDSLKAGDLPDRR